MTPTPEQQADIFADLRCDNTVCDHGSQRRKCDLCWHKVEIDHLTTALASERAKVERLREAGAKMLPWMDTHFVCPDDRECEMCDTFQGFRTALKETQQ